MTLPVDYCLPSLSFHARFLIWYYLRAISDLSVPILPAPYLVVEFNDQMKLVSSFMSWSTLLIGLRVPVYCLTNVFPVQSTLFSISFGRFVPYITIYFKSPLYCWKNSPASTNVCLKYQTNFLRKTRALPGILSVFLSSDRNTSNGYGESKMALGTRGRSFNAISSTP